MIKRVFTQTFGVVGAIIEKGGKILLVKEARAAAKGKWNQPAGWIEVGEDPIFSVKKEMREETGFDFTPTHLLGIYSLVKSAGVEGDAMHHGIKLIFVGKISDKNMNRDLEEISEVKWFLPEEIYAMDKNTLRDPDIKQEIKDYLSGKKYPLDLLTHTVQKQ